MHRANDCYCCLLLLFELLICFSNAGNAWPGGSSAPHARKTPYWWQSAEVRGGRVGTTAVVVAAAVIFVFLAQPFFAAQLGLPSLFTPQGRQADRPGLCEKFESSDWKQLGHAGALRRQAPGHARGQILPRSH